MAQDGQSQDRANLKTQLRSDIATQATNVIVLVGSGGLAGILTWLQNLPLESEQGSCEAVMINALSGAAALLLLAVLAAVVSYLLRYIAAFHERRAVAWLVALGSAALLLVGAGAWTTYSVTQCAQIALTIKSEESQRAVIQEFKLARKAGKTDAQIIEAARRRDDEASLGLELAIAEANLREIVAIEKKIDLARRLRGETSKRLDEYPELRKGLDAELKSLDDLERRLRATLSAKISR